MTIDIGIDEQARADRERLSRVLADTYTLYIKVHNFHWNLTPDVLGAAPDVRDGSDRS